MKVSIITSCYNAETYIEKTILSVLNQRYPDIEYILIDGYSKDRTMEIINTYSDRISKIVSEPDAGMYDGINKGLKLATGDICAYLNADDLYFDDTIEKVVNYFHRKPEIKWVYGGFEFIDLAGKALMKTRGFQINSQEFHSFRDSKICQPSTFWKREILSLENYFDPNYRYAADYAFISNCIQKYAYSALPDLLCQFRIHPDSISQSLNAELKQEAEKILLSAQIITTKKDKLSYYFKYFKANPYLFLKYIFNGFKHPLFY